MLFSSVLHLDFLLPSVLFLKVNVLFSPAFTFLPQQQADQVSEHH